MTTPYRELAEVPEEEDFMPYRTPAEMPEEEEEVKEMTDKEMYVKIWTRVLTAAVSVVVLIIGYNIFSTIANNSATITRAQIESTPVAAEAAKARYLEAKALSDRAMFEQMKLATEKK